jgi:serine/threonine protein kinase
MTTPHVIASSSGHHSQTTTSNGIVGNHFRVGKKIGEGSFGVVFEGEWHAPQNPFLFSRTLGCACELPRQILPYDHPMGCRRELFGPSGAVGRLYMAILPSDIDVYVSYLICSSNSQKLIAGTKLLTNQPVAIKFVRSPFRCFFLILTYYAGTTEIRRSSVTG